MQIFDWSYEGSAVTHLFSRAHRFLPPLPSRPGPAPEQPSTVEAAQSSPGRIGSHGMVLAGDPSSAFLSHIPMFAAPHDVQLVVAIHPATTLSCLIGPDFSAPCE